MDTIGLQSGERLRAEGTLGNAAHDELQRLIAGLHGWSAEQHNGDGSHGAITATSLTSSGAVTVAAAGTFDGNVIADANPIAPATVSYPVEVGTAPLVGSVRPVFGVDIRYGAVGALANVGRWREGVFATSSNDREYLWQDVGGGMPYTLRLKWDNANSRYELSPDTGYPMDLGEDVNAKRFAKLYINALGVREGGRTAAMGEWVSPAFSAGDFTASGAMTWTVAAGNVSTYAYTLVGNIMTVAFYLTGGTTGGVAAAELLIKIPGGYSAAKTMLSPCRVSDGTDLMSLCLVSAAGTTIRIFRDPSFGTNYGLGAGRAAQGTISFEVA